MSCVYIIQSKISQKFYTGSTREDSPDKRLFSHNAGKTKSTKSGRPWVLVYTEKHLDYSTARKRELFLKTGVGRQLAKKLINGGVAEWFKAAVLKTAVSERVP